jgi:5-(carboxyamino)imidazole ribonucleotide synthase
VMALELFLMNGELLANEFAPRVHNSGHWTIDGAHTSQFENHLRAICGMPLGDTGVSSPAIMFNLLGEIPAYAIQQAADPHPVPNLYWHDYHKTPREGRKIGHVTITADGQTELKARAAQLAGNLGVAAELDLEAIMSQSGE